MRIQQSLPSVDHRRRSPIAILVPVYKNVRLTARCVRSLLAHIDEIADSDPRLIIINDSPGEGELRELLGSFQKDHPQVTVIENERNVGFVQTVNKGLAIAAKDGRDVILVNADTETFSGTLRNLAEAVYSDPLIGFASPRSNNASLCSLPHFYGGSDVDQAEGYRRWEVISRTMPKLHFAPTAVGFYLYIRNEVIANFGLLDPEFGLGYEEENDLILRANKVGYRAVLVNNAYAYHAGSASFNLLGVNLKEHRDANLRKMNERHPEFLPLVRRYEASAHYRAEKLLSNLLPSSSGRLRLVFDLSSFGEYFNGTSEMGVAIVERFYERHASSFDISVVCSPEVFRFHKLDRNAGLRRHDVDLKTHERFAIGVQLGQPFTVHAVSTLEDLAVVNVFGMLDTIADDCGYLSVTHRLESLWGHVSRTANGLFFNSRFSERALIARYPHAALVPRYAELLPTRLSEYTKSDRVNDGEYVLIMGNQFAHKGSDAAADFLRAKFPNLQFVVLGKETSGAPNVHSYRAGTLDCEQMDSLYNRASIVVLPSYVEGFGLGVVHALAAGKIIVARDIPATREILSTYKNIRGVFLYKNDNEVLQAFQNAMKERVSDVDDCEARGWDEWVDGFARFCAGLVEQEDIFERLVKRIQSGDNLRQLDLLRQLQGALSGGGAVESERTGKNQAGSARQGIPDDCGRLWRPVRHIRELLHLEGEEFVHCAYVTVFNRLPDPGGLSNYLGELQAGATKLEVVSRLRNSPEGRRVNSTIPGYRSSLVKRRLRRLMRFAADKQA